MVAAVGIFSLKSFAGSPRFATVEPLWNGNSRFWFSIALGVVAVCVFLGLAWGVTRMTPRPPTGRRDWLGLIEGSDGRLSTSKLQWFVWTAMVAFAFVGISAASHVLNFPKLPSSLPSPPPNILLALGFSTVTMAMAKGITTAYVAGGKMSKSPVPMAVANNGGTAPPQGGLLTDDVGGVDLSKVQLLTWTVIALAIYLYATLMRIAQGGSAGLPDIDATLMVLTGLSMGGYLGKKLVTTTDTQVAMKTLVPTSAAPPAKVTVYGSNLGKGTTEDDRVLIDGCEVKTVQWDPDKLAFMLPAQHPCGPRDWKPPTEDVIISVLVGGEQAQGTAKLTVG